MSLNTGTLLVDISNSRTKFVLCRQDALSAPRILPTSELSHAAWAEALRGWEFRQACVSSVVPGAAAALLEALDCPVHFLSCKSRLNLGTDYSCPERWGADRLACAMALAGQGRLPAVAVDAGTAVTFDVVAMRQGGPWHLGGAISPGLRTMMLGLAKGTAQLPEIPLSPPLSPLGTDTEQCLRSGVVLGFVDMVCGVLKRLCKNLPDGVSVVLTGGDAPLLAEYLPGATVDKMLLFKGLKIAAELNSQVFFRDSLNFDCIAP